eukprot:scaffold604825_cov32-Prasinocladus_malaysianus.AAC.1
MEDPTCATQHVSKPGRQIAGINVMSQKATTTKVNIEIWPNILHFCDFELFVFFQWVEQQDVGLLRQYPEIT